MKVATLAVVASGIWSVAAQNRADYLPSCSLKCLDDATQKVTTCSLTDAVCWCVQQNYEDIYNAALTCVLNACGSDVSIKQVLPAAAKFCAAATASAKAASSTPAPTSAPASSTGVSSTAANNSTTHVTSAPSSSGATTSASSSVKSTTSSPAAGATAGPIAGVVLLVAGALAAL